MPSYTYGAIQTRIADELNRSDLTSQIQKAIISAVEAYERTRFWFNETTATTPTVADQNYVAVPSDFIKEYQVQVTVSSAKRTLRNKTYAEFLLANETNVSGLPSEYSYYSDLLYLNPTPDAVYTLTLNYIKRLTTLSGSSDTNGWTNYAEELIRSRAKADLMCNIIRDKRAQQEALLFATRGEPFLCGLEKQAFKSVGKENEEKVSTGHAKAWGY